MSVRAYRVIEIKKVEGESFNLWHDGKLVDYLDEHANFLNALNDDLCGLTELPVGVLKDAISDIPDLEASTRKALQGDIEAAEAEGKEYIRYYCY